MILKGYELNGYKWVYCDNGLNCFTKRIDDYKSLNYGQYLKVMCSDDDLINGNINYMTKKGMTRL